MSSACNVCPYYFKQFSACPTVPFSDFEERPIEYLVSLEMAIVSSNQIWDLLFTLLLCGSFKNRIHFAIAYLIPVGLTSKVFKPFFKGPRPILSCIHTYGMPSGHATAAGVIFAASLILYAKGQIRHLGITIFMCLLVVNEAFSRIYLHYHTEQQVAYGFTWGLTCSLFLMTIFQITPPKSAEEKLLRGKSFIYQNLLHPLNELLPSK